MSARRRGPAALITIALLVVLLVGAGALGERWARGEVENRVVTQIEAVLPGTTGLTAKAGGGLMLPQLIGGTLKTIDVTATSLDVQGVHVTDISGTAEGLDLKSERLANLRVRGTVTPEALLAAVQDKGLPDGVTLSMEGGRIQAKASLLGIDLVAALEPRAAERSITFALDSLRLGKDQVSLDALPSSLQSLLQLTVPLDALPEGVHLDTLETTPQGLIATFVGTDVAAPPR